MAGNSARYIRVATKIWTDEKTKPLSDDGKLLYLYILSSPHSNMAGYYVLPKPYVCYDLGWTPQRLGKPFGELLANGLIYYCETSDVVLIPNFLKYNVVQNVNQAKSANKRLRELPKNGLLREFQRLAERFAKQFAEQLTQGLVYTETDTETETEADTETEYTPATKKPSKVSYAEFVKMTEDEYDKLLTEYGQQETHAMIDILDNYKGSHGKQYKSDYRAILNWVVKRRDEERRKGAGQESAIDRALRELGP